jgi:hypothetical protein
VGDGKRVGDEREFLNGVIPVSTARVSWKPGPVHVRPGRSSSIRFGIKI